jgi:hypothetical protein
MLTAEGARLSIVIRQKMEEMKALCKGVDEDAASRAPVGRWSPKEILSHLCGPEGIGFFPTIQTILEKDTPRLDIEAENPFFTENRSRMTLKELLSEFEKEYSHMAEVVEGLSEKQLSRKAHIPLLKETPIGEYPTLAMWVQAIGEYHLGSHIDHMKEILQAIGVAFA